MDAVKIVTGAGPVGWTVASQLATAGHRVRILTRSGSGPEHPLIERIRADAADPAQLYSATQDADAIFHCIHGSKYTAEAWLAELPRAEAAIMSAAGEVGAVVIFPESLYSYSAPETVMSEHSPRRAVSGKRGVRTALLAARAASPTRTVSVVASDFFGPQVRMAHAGDRMVPLILQGKRVQVLGSAEHQHSFTYVPDLAAAMIKAAIIPEAWDSIVHAPTLPPLTQRDLAGAFARAAKLPAPRVSAIPDWVIRAAAIVSPQMREMNEMLYQFQAPFVMNSTASETLLDLSPTRLDSAARTTVAWWRNLA